jgi:hypothetical protein
MPSPDLYDSKEAAPEEKPQRPGEDGEQEHEEGGSMFLMPKECAPEAKVGDMMTIKITKILDDQVQAECMGKEEEHEEGGEGGEGGEGMSEPPPEPSQMQSMMT